MRWNGVGKLVEVQGKMNAEQYCENLEDGMEKSFESWRWRRRNATFSRTMTQSTHQNEQNTGFQTKYSSIGVACTIP